MKNTFILFNIHRDNCDGSWIATKSGMPWSSSAIFSFLVLGISAVSERENSPCPLGTATGFAGHLVPAALTLGSCSSIEFFKFALPTFHLLQLKLLTGAAQKRVPSSSYIKTSVYPERPAALCVKALHQHILLRYLVSSDWIHCEGSSTFSF